MPMTESKALEDAAVTTLRYRRAELLLQIRELENSIGRLRVRIEEVDELLSLCGIPSVGQTDATGVNPPIC